MKRKQYIILIAIFALVVIIAEVSINIFYPEIFQNFEWYGKIIMALLITMVLVVTLRSYASVTGNYLSYNFQANGAIVVFCLVFATSFTRDFFFKNDDFNFSVEVVNFNGKQMPQNMEIFMLNGTYKPIAKIDETGIATFLNIQSRLKKQQVEFKLLNSDNYTISQSSAYAIIDDQKNIKIRIERNDFILGRVIDKNQDPIDSATVTIEELDTVLYTNSNGRFKLEVPEARKQAVYNLTIKKNKTKTSGEVSLNASSDFMLDNL